MFNMFGKLQDMQRQMEDMKRQLDDLQVSAESGGGEVIVTATGNKKIVNISIQPSFLAMATAQDVEDVVMQTVNKALEKAEAEAQKQMQSAAGNMFPGLGGLLGK